MHAQFILQFSDSINLQYVNIFSNAATFYYLLPDISAIYFTSLMKATRRCKFKCHNSVNSRGSNSNTIII